MTSWLSRKTKFKYCCNIFTWSQLDEEYCLKYPEFPALVKMIIARVDTIEMQRAEISDISDTAFPVRYKLSIYRIHPNMLSNTWLNLA